MKHQERLKMERETHATYSSLLAAIDPKHPAHALKLSEAAARLAYCMDTLHRMKDVGMEGERLV